METPKSSCISMENIFKKILSRGAQKAKKWVVASWSNIIKPKLARGLGLKDSLTLNQVLGANFWCRWLMGGSDLWKNIWTRK